MEINECLVIMCMCWNMKRSNVKKKPAKDFIKSERESKKADLL